MSVSTGIVNRQLGRSNLEVARFSLGTAALGGLYSSVDDSDADELIETALATGISYFDTAPQYGHGIAEVRLGRTLSGVDRSSFMLSTKVGRLIIDNPDGDTSKFVNAPPSDAVFAFDRDSIDESLARLGLDRIDLVYIHDPDDHADQALRESYPVLHELREQGVIRAIGVGMNQSSIPTRFIAETEIDAVLLAGRYTLLDQSGLVDLIPAARRNDVSIVIGGVFNSGILADPDNAPHFDYQSAPDASIARARALRVICERHATSLISAALAFPLREPAVATVLLGARSKAELDHLLEADIDVVPAELWEELAEEGLIDELDR